MAMACFLLFTVPPFPPWPDRNVPLFLRRIALSTDLLAAFPYLATVASFDSFFGWECGLTFRLGNQGYQADVAAALLLT
jgi:hypothetical protein